MAAHHLAQAGRTLQGRREFITPEQGHSGRAEEDRLPPTIHEEADAICAACEGENCPSYNLSLKTVPTIYVYGRLIVVSLLLQELVAVKGKDALSPTAPFNEKLTLQNNGNYLVRSLEVCVCVCVCVAIWKSWV